MFDKMKQLMEMKKQADQIKRDLESMVVEVEEVQGIKISMNGAQLLQSVDINPDLLKAENKQRLQNDLLKSFNAAVKKSQLLAAQKMKDIMPGFNF